jgi:hypothetical protein
MARTEVEVANQALAKFGGGNVATFDDATALGRAVKGVYWRVVLDLLTATNWSFTRSYLQLAQLSEALMPDTYIASGWRYAYGLPAFGPGGILSPPSGYLSAPNRAYGLVRDFEVMNGVVFCDQTTLWADVEQAVGPTSWPPYFTRAVVDSLAYELVMPVSGNSGLRDSLKEEAVGPPEEGGRGGSLGKAMTADSRNDSSDTLGNNSPLVDARWE